MSTRLETEYSSIQAIGEGAYGVVYEAFNNLDKMKYAIKIVEVPLSKEEMPKYVREVQV